MISKSSSLAPLIFAILTLSVSSPTGTRNFATSSNGSMVADIPILCTGVVITESKSAIVNDNKVPLLDGTKLCNSSRIIQLKSAINGRNLEEAKARPRLSGVVIRM